MKILLKIFFYILCFEFLFFYFHIAYFINSNLYSYFINSKKLFNWNPISADFMIVTSGSFIWKNYINFYDTINRNTKDCIVLKKDVKKTDSKI